MKTTKKIVALVIAMMIVSAMAISAFAVTITITRDSSYTSGSSGTGNQYTWYKVFSADYTSGSSTTTGGGSGSYWYGSGSTGLSSGTMKKNNMEVTQVYASYTASYDVAMKLVKLVSGTTDKYERKAGNEWFDLTPIAGTNTFSVTWRHPKQDFATIQAAADWLVSDTVKAYEDSGVMQPSGDGQWTKTGLEPGYYVIRGALGANLIAATTDINITEKNIYPSLDKKQTDKGPSGTMQDARVDVQLGDEIEYQVKVSIPSTVKAGDIITVWDKASKGLEYIESSMTIEPDVADELLPKGDETWRYEIVIGKIDAPENAAEELAGKDVFFKFKMKVTDDALIDVEKENESGLEYGNRSGTYFESIPDKVKYMTYFTGLYKYDGAAGEMLDAPLEGVWFQLLDGNDRLVYLVQSGSYYIPTSGTVSGTTGAARTNASGTIYIRGLDEDLKKYKVLEIKNENPGFNMISGTVNLELYEDTIEETNESGVVTRSVFFDDNKNEVAWSHPIENNKGALLPSTGGMGTTILYIAGAILVLGAGILLVTKRRANY